jgi:uncharacterized protein
MIMNVPYKNKAVQDLAWVITSPALMELPECECPELVQDTETIAAWLLALDNAPEQLEQCVRDMKRHTLGSYYETLVGFWLANRPDIQVRAVNLQVSEEKITVGEFDFVVQTPEKLFHVEVAVKFYLQLHHSDQWEHWIGARGHDCLGSKMEKLLHQQLQLGKRPSGKQALAEKGVDNVTPSLFLKGYFFYPHQAFFSAAITPPHHANPYHLRGWWCPVEDVEYFSKERCLWAAPAKSDWLAPACYLTAGQLMGYGELVDYLNQHFSNHSKPVLLTAMQPDRAGVWHEQHRGFIMPEKWVSSVI